MRLLQIAIAAVVLAWLAAWWQTRQLPERAELLPELMQEPRQQATGREPFSFEYRGADYAVQPVASYELHGLVVTHNDTTGLGDLTHDENSLDTKDLCVIWGPNLAGDDYRKVSYESSPTWCWYTYRGDDIRFNPAALSNNHLVTDRDELRTVLDRVHVGDQVRFRGMLVNYQDRRWNGWRNTSTRRDDSGGGACEVVFFEELQVLKPHATRAWQLRRVLPWVLGALLGAALVVAATTSPRFD